MTTAASTTRRGGAGSAVLLIVAALASLLALLVTGTGTLSLAIIVCTVFVMSIGAFSGRLAPPYLSPVTITSGALLALGLLGSAFYSAVQYAAEGGSAAIFLSEEQTRDTLIILATAATCVLVAGLLTVSVGPRIAKPAEGFHIHLDSRWRFWLLLGSFTPLLITVVVTGGDLLVRGLYIDEAVQDAGILSIAGQLSVAAVIALGYIAGAAGGWPRFMALIGGASYFLLFFSGGSRRLALFPVLFAVGLLAARRNKWTVMLLLLSIPLSLYLIRTALYLRGLPEHGLLPYLAALPGLADYPVGWDSILKNVLISFGIIGATVFQRAPIDPAVFWVSVNPLPGAAAGWYEAASTLRINYYTPYAGVGELANYGPAYLIGFFLVVGVILGVFDLQVQALIRDKAPVLALVVVGLTGLFVLYMVQYNLRSASRMIIYGIAASLAIAIVHRAMVRRRENPAARRDKAPARLGSHT